MIVFIVIALSVNKSNSQAPGRVSKRPYKERKIHWYELEEVKKLTAKYSDKKIFLYAYIDSSRGCEIYDSVFSSSIVAKYINKNFFAFKFNFQRDSMYMDKLEIRRFKEFTKYPISLTEREKNAFPIIAILDDDLGKIRSLNGYYKPKELEAFIYFMGNKDYKLMNFEDYVKTYKGQLRKQ